MIRWISIVVVIIMRIMIPVVFPFSFAFAFALAHTTIYDPIALPIAVAIEIHPLRISDSHLNELLLFKFLFSNFIFTEYLFFYSDSFQKLIKFPITWSLSILVSGNFLHLNFLFHGFFFLFIIRNVFYNKLTSINESIRFNLVQ